MSLGTKRLEREDYWYRELCTLYPYGLNDNVRGVGNLSKCGHNIVVHTLFNKHQRKFRKRNARTRKRKIDLGALATQFDNVLSAYKFSDFMYNLKCLILSLPNKCMIALSDMIDNWLTGNDVPDRIAVLTQDLMAYKKRSPRMETACINVGRDSTNSNGFMTVCYHNKGIEMIDLPRLLNSKTVKDAVPHFLSNREQPMVSYAYTKNISGRIFNQKRVMEGLDFDVGTGDMCCDCSTSEFCYEPVGHIVTGDLTIIRDAKLRALIGKGPSYREQNFVDWKKNIKICSEAVTAYKHKWSKKERVDYRVLNEWEHRVNECVEKRIRLLEAKNINKRRQHVLRAGRHLYYLHDFQSKFVLVPADKAANNVIVVCRKYYLDVVLRELNGTSTYEHKDRDLEHIVNEHIDFMTDNSIHVETELRLLPSFYWLPKLHKTPYGTRFIAASRRCTTKPLSKLLTVCLAKINEHFKQYCNGIHLRTGVNCYWIVDNSQQVLTSLNKINYS